MINTIFGNNLMRLRKEHKLTRQAFADVLKLPVTTVAGYETAGREPKFSLLIKIADYFGVSIDNLIRKNDIAFKTVNNSVTLEIPENLSKEEVQKVLTLHNELLKTAQDAVERAFAKNEDVPITLIAHAQNI